MEIPPETSKFGSIHVNIRAQFKRPQERPKMLCAKWFVLFVVMRDGGGVRDDYPR